jgi:AcrR family transcriptional regulator
MATPAPVRVAYRRRQRRTDEVRARILAAAADLFSRHGIVNTPVENITAAADVAKGTFFNYFPTKEAAAAELAKRLTTDLWIVSRRARYADTVRPILQSLPEVFLGAFGHSPALARSVVGVMLLHESQDEAFREITGTTRDHLAYILERGQELGEIRGDRSAAGLALALQQSLWGALTLWRQGDDVAQLMTPSLEIFWSGAAVAASDDEDWGV